jgi:hypothetical protein
MIGFLLIVEMAHASDVWRMAVLFRPVDGFVLCFERGEYVVGVVFDHIIVKMTSAYSRIPLLQPTTSIA